MIDYIFTFKDVDEARAAQAAFYERNSDATRFYSITPFTIFIREAINGYDDVKDIFYVIQTPIELPGYHVCITLKDRDEEVEKIEQCWAGTERNGPIVFWPNRMPKEYIQYTMSPSFNGDKYMFSERDL